MRKVTFKKEIMKYSLFFLFGALMVLFCSASTSPLFPYYRGTDNSLFLVMGKEWLNGHIPYRDLFDQKGPAIFFVDMLGYFFTGNRYGVLIIQIIASTISVLFIYKILARSMKDISAIIFACLGIFVFACNYEYGNMVEEYINPFLIISFYLISEWLAKKTPETPEHNPLYASVYGLTFGLCVMSRITNAISVCVAVLFIVIYLCIEKAWINLLKNAISFILGSMLAILPFMIYFSVKNCTYDFWYGTILYNISYAIGSSSSLTAVIKGFPRQIGSYTIIGTGILLVLNRKYFDGLLYMVVGISMQYLLLSILSFPHYSMITFHLIPISIYELKRLIRDNSNYIKKLSILLLIGSTLIFSYKTVKELSKVVLCYNEYSSKNSETPDKPYKQVCDLFEQIPQDERNSVVAYNVAAGIYLDKDFSPACKFFINQDWQAEFSDEFKQLLIDEFLLKEPKWIIYSGNDEPVIKKSVLDINYQVYASEKVSDQTGYSSTIALYRRID